MGVLTHVWRESQKKFGLSLKQCCSIAGDGNLLNANSADEFRRFLSEVDKETLERLLHESYSEDKKLKFDQRGYAFQDITNEIGIRLGYQVEHGLLKGKVGEIGYDGFWDMGDGNYLIMEAKVSGAYAFDPEVVMGYHDSLVRARGINKNKLSILVVFGHDEKMTIKNAVKGSNHAGYIRVISANALFQLMKIHGDVAASRQINRMLRPFDYFILDNLVELVFPQTDDDIPDVPEDDNPQEDNPSDDNPSGSNGDDKTESEKTIPPRRGQYKKAEGIPDGEELFHYARKKVVATGYYLVDTDSFIVLSGSGFSESETSSCDDGIRFMRQRLIDDGVVVNHTFKDDIWFSSPSAAAAVVCGGSQNGRTMWKNDEGITIKKKYDGETSAGGSVKELDKGEL